jgi:hypothetical protein
MKSKAYKGIGRMSNGFTLTVEPSRYSHTYLGVRHPGFHCNAAVGVHLSSKQVKRLSKQLEELARE